MELRHVKYFLAVADELNFTRAAARVGIGQPPLSQQIRSLEQEVGQPLFLRTRTGAELTAAGVAFLPLARDLLAQAERALQAARSGGQGEIGQLRVGFTSSAAFIPAVPQSLRAFRRAYDRVSVQLLEAATNLLLDALAEERMDAAFIRLGPTDPEGVEVRTLLRERMRIVLPDEHRLRGRSLPLSAMKGEAFILFPRQSGPSLFDGIVQACRDAGFEPRLGQEAPQMLSAIKLVAAGMGVSLVPDSISKSGLGGVRYATISGPAPYVRLALAVRPGQRSPIVHNFVSVVSREVAGDGS